MKMENNLFTGSIRFQLRGQCLWLLPQKAIYWQEKSALVMADVHLGKAGHFRKAGIPVPSAIHQDDIAKINQLISKSQATQVYILGDLFHSEYNKEWEDFEALLHENKKITFTLVKGNHDILPEAAYQNRNLQVIEDILAVPPFCFTHKPAFQVPSMTGEQSPPLTQEYEALYNLSGHIHPGICLHGKAGQNFKMPCFFFTKQGGILPAFGRFTGFICLNKKYQDFVFGIAELSEFRKQVLKIS